MRRVPTAMLISSLFLCCCVLTASAQAPGYAQLLFPERDNVLTGVMTITGSASHPSFVYYELSFALDPNETGTWFPIGERMTTEVQDGNLGIWDTTLISDGSYQLRLEVVLAEDVILEARVEGLQIRNYTAPDVVETPSVTEATAFIQTPTMEPTWTPIPQLTGTQPTPPEAQTRVVQAFAFGAALGGAALLGTGIFLAARRDMRSRRAQRKMRSLLRSSEDRMQE